MYGYMFSGALMVILIISESRVGVLEKINNSSLDMFIWYCERERLQL